MTIHLLRHGLAADCGPGIPTDRDRPLTEEGRDKLAHVAKAMAEMDLGLELILSSPFLRAAQTAGQIADELALRKHLQFCDELAVDGTPGAVLQHLDQVRPRPASVLLVGHEPLLGEIVSMLLTGRTGLSLVFKKAGLARISAPRPRPGEGTLEWLLTPKQLARMA